MMSRTENLVQQLHNIRDDSAPGDYVWLSPKEAGLLLLALEWDELNTREGEE